jgi:hypothetical protein
LILKTISCPSGNKKSTSRKIISGCSARLFHEGIQKHLHNWEVLACSSSTTSIDIAAHAVAKYVFKPGPDGSNDAGLAAHASFRDIWQVSSSRQSKLISPRLGFEDKAFEVNPIADSFSVKEKICDKSN